uniref:Putative ribonuclease H-like domain-containing protein n=1 Tax=Tanacetum cinerariifolium TaxID=118510 RepID=A0A6L2P1G1_TANCI|nr:putative ribonuclease H-like domain-containing protein [Tanacetum cinerariifolium]
MYCTYFLPNLHKANKTQGTKACDNVGKTRVETIPDNEYILLPLWTQDLQFSLKDSSGANCKPSGEEENNDAKDPRNKYNEVPSTEEPRVNQEMDTNVNSTNNINTVSLADIAAGIKDNAVNENIVYGWADMNNLGIDYDEVFAHVARIEAIRLFLAYASFKDFVVYQMDVKSAFLYGKIKEEVYVCQPPRFKDPDFPDIVYKVEKALYGLHQDPRAWYESLSTYLLDNRFQRGILEKTLFIKGDKSDILLVQMSSMGELTFFLGLQVKQIEDGIFISQDKYVNEILNKFGFSDVKTGSTPMETHKTLLKDEKGEDVDEHLYRSIIGSLMYLTSSRPDIMFATTTKAKNINREAQIHAKVDGNKVTIFEASIRRDLRFRDEGGVDFLSNEVIFEQLTLIGAKATAWNEFSSTVASVIIYLATDQKLNFSKYIFDSMVKNLDSATKFLMYPRKQKPRKTRRQNTKLPQTSVPTKTVANKALNEENVPTKSNDSPLSRVNILGSGEDRLKLKELMELYTKLSDRVLNLETTTTSQAQEIISLKKRVKRLEKKRRDEDIFGVNDQDDTLMFHANKDLQGEEVFVEEVNAASIATAVTTAATTPTISIDDITLAKALIEIKTSRPKAKGIVMQELSEAPTTTTIRIPSKVQDKGKCIMVEEPLKMKKKDKISFDEQEARRLQAEIDEQDRLAAEEAQKPLEANNAMIEQWHDVQAKVDADYELAQRLQAKEQEQLTDAEKANLFMEFLEKRRKLFAAKRAKEKRNRPPTQAQQTSLMCTYLKNMDRLKPKNLKNKDSSKRAEDELEQEIAKKKRIDDENESAKLKRCLEIVPDNRDDVTIDATPLSSKFPTILQVDYECEMAYELLRLVKKQLKEGYRAKRSVWMNPPGDDEDFI